MKVPTLRRMARAYAAQLPAACESAYSSAVFSGALLVTLAVLHLAGSL